MAQLSKKSIIVISIVTFVIVASSILLVSLPAIIASRTQDLAQNPDTPSNGELVVSEEQKRYEKALSTAVSDSTEAGQAILDEALESADSKQERAMVYTQKSAVAIANPDSPDFESALEFALRAEQEDPSYGTAIVIAELQDYDFQNYSEAIKYYKLYLDRLTEEASELNPGDRAFYENRLRELEQQ